MAVALTGRHSLFFLSFNINSEFIVNPPITFTFLSEFIIGRFVSHEKSFDNLDSSISEDEYDYKLETS